MPHFALCIVLGSILAFYQTQLSDVFWSAYWPLLTLPIWLLPRFRTLAILAVAYLWSNGFYSYHLSHQLASDFDQQITMVQGQIIGIPEQGQFHQRFYLEPHKIQNYHQRLPRLIRLNWYQVDKKPTSGEHWQFEVKLKKTRGFVNPGGFDFEAWQFVKGIDAGGYVRKSTYNQRLANAVFNLDAWRSELASSLDQQCVDCEFASLIQALSLGHRANIDRKTNQLLRDSGVAHLLAISGLHIGVVSLAFFALGGFFWRFVAEGCRLNRIEFGSISAGISAFAYAAMAGFSLPTVRALIMLLVILITLWCRTRVNLLQSISFAVIVILIVDPRSIGSASFWLSISALLIIAIAQLRLHSSMRWWQQLTLLQMHYCVLLLPITVMIFSQIAPAGFFANLVAIPLVTFVVLPLVLLASLLSFFGCPVGWLLKAADFSLQALLSFLDWLLSSPLKTLSGVAIPLPLLGLLLLALLLLVLPVSVNFKRLILPMIAILASWQPPQIPFAGFQADVLDVGMGTSILLRTRNHSLVYDFGPGNDRGFSVADWALVPLIARELGELPDLLIVSHVDQDHSGGFQSFLMTDHSTRLISGTPQLLRQRFQLDYSVQSCHRGQSWVWDGVEFEFLNQPDDSMEPSTNGRSCVLMVTGNHRLLIPGDIEVKQELKLVALQRERLKADVLIAPHHGSKTSSSFPFLYQVKPQHVIFTVAHGNRWKFPANEVKARYAALGVEQTQTDMDGAVRLISTHGGLTLSRIRRSTQRIWRQW